MPYGSARMRMFYGAGDYGRAAAAVQMARGYYPGGGFFDFVKKAAGGIVKAATPILGAVGSVSKLPVVGSLLKALPVVGTGLSLAQTAGEIIGGLGAKRIEAGGVQLGESARSVQQLRSVGLLPGPKAVLPSFNVERASPRRKRSGGGRRRRTGGTSRRRRRAGDYGDDWSGNRPSRAKGSGRFLTRAGGRRRKRHRGRRRGQRVSFVTKGGKRVSFTAKGDGEE